MAISEDLKSVHLALAAVSRSVSVDKEPVIRLACANILSLAEQVKALESMPLDTTAYLFRSPIVPADPSALQ